MIKLKNKRILSTVLLVVMLFSIFPLHAFAEQPTTGSEVNPETSNEKFDQHVVETINPGFMTINLFDYWKKEKNTNDRPASKDYVESVESGINRGRPFKFLPMPIIDGTSKDKNDKAAMPWHEWTNEPSQTKDANGIDYECGPYTGIVENKLGADGYPVLSKTIMDYAQTKGYNTDQKSLDYLFEPSTGDIADKDKNLDFRSEHLNVKDLLQLDNRGTYYYNSIKNFAEYDENTGNFKTYNAPAVTGAFSEPGQFFPFNQAEQVFEAPSDHDEKLTGNSSIISNSNDANIINHYFGMTMETKFVQPKEGELRNDVPMYLEFAGDDDIWIFVDDVLVVDMGGCHDTMYSYIDFSTGKIEVMRYDDREKEKKQYTPIETTLKKAFEKAGQDTKTGFNGDTFGNETEHEIKIFYLERGNSASNLWFNFNLLGTAVQEVAKVDQDGNPMEGVSFDTYHVNKKDDWSSIDSEPILSFTTDANGIIKLAYPNDYIDKDKAGTPVDFSEIAKRPGATNQYVIREKSKLGYISTPDIRAEYNVDLNVINIVNPWETGVAATNDMYLTQKGDGLKIRDHAREETKAIADEHGLVKPDISKGGLAVAVPYTLKPNGTFLSDADWIPMYGSTESGFHTVHEDYIKPSDDKFGKDWATYDQAMLSVLLQLTGSHIDENGNVHVQEEDTTPYRHWTVGINPNTDRYEGDLFGLPGNIDEYTFSEHDTSKDHTLGYWFFDALGLKTAIQTAVDDNKVLTSQGAMSVADADAQGLFYLDQDSIVQIDAVITAGTDNAKKQLLIHTYKSFVVKDAVGSYENTLQWIKLIGAHLHPLNLSSFDGAYSSNITVPNILRTFEIQKIDNGGNNLADAEFTLYSDKNCTEKLASGTTDANGKIVVSTKEDGSVGTMQFNLEPKTKDTFTTYYLKETKAPEGYQISDTIIEVNVDATGVYIGAGESGDDVSVRSGVVGAVPTVHTFGISDGYNETLKEIFTKKYTQKTFSTDRTSWVDSKETVNYIHGDEFNTDAYIPDANEKKYLEVDEGFMALYIGQNNPKTPYKEDISKENIAALFEVVQTVVMTNEKLETGGEIIPPPTVDPTPPPTVEPPTTPETTDPTTPETTDPTPPETTDPTTPETTEPATPETTMPHTGDNSIMMVWVLIAIASGLGLLVACRKSFINKDKRK